MAEETGLTRKKILTFTTTSLQRAREEATPGLSEKEILKRAANIFLTAVMHEEAMPEQKRLASVNQKLDALDGEAKKLLPELVKAWEEGAVDEEKVVSPAFFPFGHNDTPVKRLVNADGQKVVPFNDLYTRIHDLVPNVVWILKKLEKKKILHSHYGRGSSRFVQTLRREGEDGKRFVLMTPGKFDPHDLVSSLDEGYIVINDWDDLLSSLTHLDSANKDRAETIVDLKDRLGESWVNPVGVVSEIFAIVSLDPVLKGNLEVNTLLEAARLVAQEAQTH